MLDLIAAAVIAGVATSGAVAAPAAGSAPAGGPGPVRLGLHHAESGPDAAAGLDRRRAARLAVDEINAAGGVLGRPVELVVRGVASGAASAHASIDEGVVMLIGGATPDAAAAVSGVAQARGVPFFAVPNGASDVVVAAATRHAFHAGLDAHASAVALADVLGRADAAGTFAFLTGDDDRSRATEARLRAATSTEDRELHERITIESEPVTDEAIRRAIDRARTRRPDVLVVALPPGVVERALLAVADAGLAPATRVVATNLTLDLAERVGPRAMEGVLGALAWSWRVPYEIGSGRGIAFVEAFGDRYERRPSAAGATAYTIVHQWKDAVERAGSFDAAEVIVALEGHRFTLLKDEQSWRDFDHRCVQTVFVVRGRDAAAVERDRFGLDCFEIVASSPGADVARSRDAWTTARTEAGLPPHLEPLPGERAVAGVPID